VPGAFHVLLNVSFFHIQFLTMHALKLFAGLVGVANAACPYMTGEMSGLERRDSGNAASDTEEFLSQFYLDDQDAFMTSDVGGPIEDQNSLSAGERGPTLLEDFIFRQKIQRFDHERVCTSHNRRPGRCLLMQWHIGPRTRCPRPRCRCPRSLHIVR
jgi:hypothetical protein